jgi:uncharacterized membrane protein YtjA (UPF0391 family)
VLLLIDERRGMHTTIRRVRSDHKMNQLNLMINWAIAFLVIAVIAAVLGFGGIAGTAVGIAKILFFVFLVLFVIAFAMGRRTPPV